MHIEKEYARPSEYASPLKHVRYRRGNACSNYYDFAFPKPIATSSMLTTDQRAASAMCVFIVIAVLVNIKVLVAIALHNTGSTMPSD